MTLTATKAAFRGFRNGLKQVKMGDYEACIADLWAALESITAIPSIATATASRSQKQAKL